MPTPFALTVLDDAVQSGDLVAAKRVAEQILSEHTALTLGHESPWSRGDWSGAWETTDDCDVSPFECDADNILLVIAYGDSGPGWDGEAADIVLLADGRYCSWESNWGPTGSGFQQDAYGGDANVCFSKTLRAAELYISERGRECLKYVGGE